MDNRLSLELESQLLRRTLSASHNLVKNKKNILSIFRMAVFIEVDGHKHTSYSYSNSRNNQQLLSLFFSEIQLFFSCKIKIKHLLYGITRIKLDNMSNAKALSTVSDTYKT